MGEEKISEGHEHHDHDHEEGFAISQLAMNNNILVNTLIDLLIEKGVITEDELEKKLGEDVLSEEDLEESSEDDNSE